MIVRFCDRQLSLALDRRICLPLAKTRVFATENQQVVNAAPVFDHRNCRFHSRSNCMPSFTNFPRRQHAQSRKLIAALPIELIIVTCDQKHLCSTFQGGKRLLITMKSRRSPPSLIEMDKLAQVLVKMLLSAMKGKSLMFCVSSFNSTMKFFVQAINALKNSMVEFTIDIHRMGTIYAKVNGYHGYRKQINSVTDLCKLFRIIPSKITEQGANHKKRCNRLIEHGVAVRKCLKRLQIATHQKSVGPDIFLTSFWKIILVRSKSVKDMDMLTIELFSTDSKNLIIFTGPLSEVLLSIVNWVAKEQFLSLGKGYLFAFSSSVPHAEIRKALVNLSADFSWVRYVSREFSKIIESENSLESTWQTWCTTSGSEQRVRRSFIHDVCYRSSKYHLERLASTAKCDNGSQDMWSVGSKITLPLRSKEKELIGFVPI